MKRLISLATSVLIINLSAQAAIQGTLAGRSEGRLNVNLVVTKNANIKVSGFEHYLIDYKLAEDIPSAKTMDICVYMDQTGTYSIDVDAAVLTDTVTNYSYKYTYTDNANSALFLTETISDTAGSAAPVSGSTPSYADENCATGGTSATFDLELDGDPLTTTTQTATATIMFTVRPD
ncbi:MAG: hypothetical protein ACE37M_03415 [Henriciella sp.]